MAVTYLAIKRPEIDALLAGKLVFQSKGRVVVGQRGAGVEFRDEHLLPVAQAPICATCGGSKQVRSKHDTWRECWDCRDGMPLALTLTVEVPGRCTCGTSFDFLGHLSGCEFYVLATQRPVARVQVTGALPIVSGAGTVPPKKDCIEVCPGNLVWWFWSDADLKITFQTLPHLLLPGVDWSGTAMVVTDVKEI